MKRESRFKAHFMELLQEGETVRTDKLGNKQLETLYRDY
jgi:hypothetical protein